MNGPRPRLVIAALRGGAGKTTLSVAMTVALRRQGVRVIPFKKGPDYIDAAWLSRAASGPCYNLDTYLMGTEQVVRSFSRHSAEGSVSLIEGNRGLFDGVSASGEFSTAELAKLLHAPVILTVDCDKVTRTTAAMVLGCMNLDPELDIRGVILSRVNGSRHARVISQSIEEYTGLKVYGVVPRLADVPLTQRHLGLIPPAEHEQVRRALDKSGAMAEEYLDIDGLLAIAESASPWKIDAFPSPAHADRAGNSPVTIGLIQDTAFQFYYPENIEALTDRGARIVRISALDDEALPDVDALYIGGGFPETHAGKLAANESLRCGIRKAAQGGMPIYGECGGFIYLGESLTIGGISYPMAGVLPVSFSMEKRPQGHGYTKLGVDRENPFFPVGSTITGHEFHYCRVVKHGQDEMHTAFNVIKGTGIDGTREGLCMNNVMAGFTHLHALGAPQWAERLIDRARQYRRRTGSSQSRISVGNGFDTAPSSQAI